MRLLLIHPPPLGKDKYQEDIVHPPLGLAYIAAYVREDHVVDIIDANALKLKLGELKKKIQRFKPDVVGITSTTANIFNAFKVAKLVKYVDKNIVTILGGVHSTSSPKHALSCKHIDYLCVGEGEKTIKDFLDWLDRKKSDPNHVKGIAFRKDGDVCFSPPRELTKNLDEFPMPAYDLLPVDKYSSIQSTDDKIMTLITSRGCPYQCIFCDVQVVFGRSYRVHSPERVLSEIEYLMDNYSIREFHFKDSEFTLIPKRVIEICQLIIDRGIKISWWCNGRVNHMSLELLKKMKKAGCKGITFGVESGNDEILKTLKKAYTRKDVINAFSLAKKAGVESTANFIIGNPGDTKETINDTIMFAKKIDPDYASFNFLIPFPNTELYKMAEKNHWLLSNWSFENIKYDSVVMNATKIPLEELEKYVKKAFWSFYLRPAYIFKRIKKLSWHEMKMNVKGAKKLLLEMFN